eukprot:m51a1_g9448 hypothetical protein (128) ;mRNA; f:487142-487621
MLVCGGSALRVVPEALCAVVSVLPVLVPYGPGTPVGAAVGFLSDQLGGRRPPVNVITCLCNAVCFFVSRRIGKVWLRVAKPRSIPRPAEPADGDDLDEKLISYISQLSIGDTPTPTPGHAQRKLRKH